MTKREFVTKSGDTWEWEETPEVLDYKEYQMRKEERRQKERQTRIERETQNLKTQAPNDGV